MTTQGYILDFSDAVGKLPSDAGANYISYQDRRLKDPFLRFAEKDPLVNARSRIAEPLILGNFSPAQGRVINHEGFEIKAPGDFKIYLPGDEDYAVSVVHVAATDLLNLCGPKVFQDAKLVYVTQSTIVPTDKAHREQFAGWHDHVTSTRHPIDLIYAFHTTLPTEFDVKGQIVQPPENVLCRFGGEMKHRSQRNAGDPVPRQWGAILVLDAEYYPPEQNPAANLKDDPLYKTFEASAKEVLRRVAQSKTYERPISVAASYAQRELRVA